MDEKKDHQTPNSEAVAPDASPKPKRGRPKVSPHDRATQKRISVQRYREAKRNENEVALEVYLPGDWHDWLVNVKGANLREVAVEAFALWLKKHGYPADVATRTVSTEDA